MRRAGSERPLPSAVFFAHAVPKSTPVYVHAFLTGQAQVSWNVVCKLIAQVDARCAEELLAIGVPDQDSIPAVAETLENLECAEEAYIVLDRFEASGLPQPERLLEALSPPWRGMPACGGAHAPARSGAGPLANHRIYLLEADTFAFRAEDTEAYFKSWPFRSKKQGACRASGDGRMGDCAAYADYGIHQIRRFFRRGMDELMQEVLWDSLSEAERGFFPFRFHLSAFYADTGV